MCGTVQEVSFSHILAQFFTNNHTSFTFDIPKTKVYSKTTAPPFGRRSSRSQYSIRVAHGITAHGAQGQTIHEPFVVQCDQCWDSGHLLVMLSRASDPNLMRLVNLDRARPFIAPAKSADCTNALNRCPQAQPAKTRARPRRLACLRFEREFAPSGARTLPHSAKARANPAVAGSTPTRRSAPSTRTIATRG